MTFARQKFCKVDYLIENNFLDRVYSFSDLGVLMDPKLRFNFHIDSIVNTASGTLGCIKRFAKEFNDPYITKQLFTSIVRPILEYASVIWPPTYNVDISRIETISTFLFEKSWLAFTFQPTTLRK